MHIIIYIQLYLYREKVGMNLTYSCLPIEPMKLHQMSMKFMQNLTVTRS